MANDLLATWAAITAVLLAFVGWNTLTTATTLSSFFIGGLLLLPLLFMVLYAACFLVAAVMFQVWQPALARRAAQRESSEPFRTVWGDLAHLSGAHLIANGTLPNDGEATVHACDGSILVKHPSCAPLHLPSPFQRKIVHHALATHTLSFMDRRALVFIDTSYPIPFLSAHALIRARADLGMA